MARSLYPARPAWQSGAGMVIGPRRIRLIVAGPGRAATGRQRRRPPKAVKASQAHRGVKSGRNVPIAPMSERTLPVGRIARMEQATVTTTKGPNRLLALFGGSSVASLCVALGAVLVGAVWASAWWVHRAAAAAAAETVG